MRCLHRRLTLTLVALPLAGAAVSSTVAVVLAITVDPRQLWVEGHPLHLVWNQHLQYTDVYGERGVLSDGWEIRARMARGLGTHRLWLWCTKQREAIDQARRWTGCVPTSYNAPPIANLVDVRETWNSHWQLPLPTTSADDPLATSTSAIWAGFGWPLLSLSYTGETDPVDGYPTHTSGLNTALPQWSSAGDTRGIARIVPITPIWSGLLVDSALYAAALAGIGGLWTRSRRRFRRRTGRCVGCRYPVMDLDVCPECGTPHAFRAG